MRAAALRPAIHGTCGHVIPCLLTLVRKVLIMSAFRWRLPPISGIGECKVISPALLGHAIRAASGNVLEIR